MSFSEGTVQSISDKLANLTVSHTGHAWNHRKRITPKDMMAAAVRGRVAEEKTFPMCRLLIQRRVAGRQLEPYIAQPFLLAAIRNCPVRPEHRELFQIARNNHGGLLLDMPCGHQEETVVMAFLKKFDEEIGCPE